MTRTRQPRPAALIVALLLVSGYSLAGAPAAAQSASTVSGTVRNVAGALVAGATVTATSLASGAVRSAVTDTEGQYQLTALAGGPYEVRAALSGMRAEARKIDLSPGSTTLDFSLNGEGLEEIVVTALKRSERLQDVPASVDAFDTGMLEQAGVTSMRDYLALAPQISLVETQNMGFAFVNVRGLSQVRNSEPAVAVVVDGVLQTTALGFSQELYDADQVEVLKGPQGALYGRNASGGAINITTREPTNNLRGFARLGYGNGENVGFNGAVSGPIVKDVLMGRAAVSITDSAGWRQNLSLGRKADHYSDRSVRGRLLWRPTPTVSGDLRLSYSKGEGGASQFVSNAPNFVMAPPVGGLPGLAATLGGRINGTASVVPGVPASIAALVGDANNTSVGIQGDIAGIDDREITAVSAKLDWHAARGTLTSVTAFDRLTLLGTLETFPYFPFLQSAADPAAGTRTDAIVLPAATYGPLASINASTGQNRFHDAWSQEVRFASPDNSRVRWIVGGYAAATDLDVMISVNRDLGSDAVLQNRDPNIGGVNPTATWNERFIAAVAPVYAANPGLIPSACLSGAMPATVCAASRANPNTNPAALAYNLDNNNNNAYAVFGNASADLGEQVEVSLALRYDRDDRRLTLATRQSYLPVFAFASGQEADVRKQSYDAWQPKATLRWKPAPEFTVYGSYGQGFRSGGFNLSGVAAGVAALRSAGVPGMPQGVQDSWKQEDTRGAEFGFKSSLLGGAATFNASGFYTHIDNAFTFFFVAPYNAQTVRNIDEARTAGLEATFSWLPVSGLQFDLSAGLLDSEILASAWVGTGGVDIVGKKLPFNPDSTVNAAVSYSRAFGTGWQGSGRFDYERLGRTPFDPENFTARNPVNLVNLRGGITVPGGLEIAGWVKNLTNKAYMAETLNPNGISWLARPRQWGVELVTRF